MIGILLTMLIQAYADDGHSHQHKHARKESHAAHVHGEASLTIALEGDREGEMEFRAPGDSIVGFEHKPKNYEDRVRHEQAINNLKKDFNLLVIFDPARKCTVQNEKARADFHDGHAEFEGHYHFFCEKDLKGSTMVFAFNKVFPRIEQLQVQVLGVKSQDAKTLKKGQGKISLK